MPKQRSWSDKQLIEAVRVSRSLRMVLHKLHLVPAGGNYDHVTRIISELGISTGHFKGKGWNNGIKTGGRPRLPLADLLVLGSRVQSYKLKVKLFEANLKTPKCELCGWCERSIDGRIPLELDHLNGDHQDNRIENLRILCPNCHSLQITHRGKNKKNRLKLL